MSTLPNFKKYVAESDDDDAELRSMGFKSDLEFDERLSNVIDEWYDDPAVQSAIRTLQDKANQLMAKHEIDTDDPDDEREWQQRVDWTYDNGIDEVGWFEFVTMVAI